MTGDKYRTRAHQFAIAKSFPFDPICEGVRKIRKFYPLSLKHFTQWVDSIALGFPVPDSFPLCILVPNANVQITNQHEEGGCQEASQYPCKCSELAQVT